MAPMPTPHRRRRLSALALIVATLVVAASGGACGSSRSAGSAQSAAGPGAGAGDATIVRVVDGDTLKVRIGGRTDRVRLLGIDTPESVKPNTPVECFAKEASAHTASLLPPGTAVRLVRDVEVRDDYKRLLAYVYRSSDGLFVNLALARDGYATTLTHPPNVAHADELVRAVQQARDARRGLWGRCAGPHVAAH
jgi:micrococcal nuclease